MTKGDIVNRIGISLRKAIAHSKKDYDQHRTDFNFLIGAVEEYRKLLQKQENLLELLETLAGRGKENQLLEEEHLVELINIVTIASQLGIFLQLDANVISTFLEDVDAPAFRVAWQGLSKERQNELK